MGAPSRSSVGEPSHGQGAGWGRPDPFPPSPPPVHTWGEAPQSGVPLRSASLTNAAFTCHSPLGWLAPREGPDAVTYPWPKVTSLLRVQPDPHLECQPWGRELGADGTAAAEISLRRRKAEGNPNGGISASSRSPIH
ncbi:protein TBRG4 [Platysternon megacephalum]|uniref:Protein TBRG4 n=1 Tax=Platysternon megacephalum TaxID=55544 RepID=A0A4D9EKB0_9SAUR|nr:protein TBRG4 [Platysternon megacephalum]